MQILRFNMATYRNLSFLIFVFCTTISIKIHNAEIKKYTAAVSSFPLSANISSSSPSNTLSEQSALFSADEEEVINVETRPPDSLEYDFYRDSCPAAEKSVRDLIRKLCKIRPGLGPAIVRLFFHDCFVEGCDASVLLDAVEGMRSEKDTPPNETLKGFDAIDIIKSEIEDMCPGVVSCADILVLAAREAILLAGGPFYPLSTGRRDSTTAYPKIVVYQIPSPHADISEILASFASKGFDERETVSLLGAHSTGTTHCRFFNYRLYNFDGTGKPDPSLDSEFLNLLKSKCNSTQKLPSRSSAPSTPFTGAPLSISLSAPTDSRAIDMTYGESEAKFGTVYYRHLLQSKGILFSDQQLTASEETKTWVKVYASAPSLFHRDFALAMMKLSNLQVLTGPIGQIRRNCSQISTF